jgi:hypothetical protein
VASARERTRADAAVAAAKAENRRLQAVAVERERARRARDGGQHGGGGRRGGWTEVGGKSRQGGRGERGGPWWPAVVGSAQVQSFSPAHIILRPIIVWSLYEEPYHILFLRLRQGPVQAYAKAHAELRDYLAATLGECHNSPGVSARQWRPPIGDGRGRRRQGGR